MGSFDVEEGAEMMLGVAKEACYVTISMYFYLNFVFPFSFLILTWSMLLRHSYYETQCTNNFLCKDVFPSVNFLLIATALCDL